MHYPRGGKFTCSRGACNDRVVKAYGTAQRADTSLNVGEKRAGNSLAAFSFGGNEGSGEGKINLSGVNDGVFCSVFKRLPACLFLESDLAGEGCLYSSLSLSLGL